MDALDGRVTRALIIDEVEVDEDKENFQNVTQLEKSLEFNRKEILSQSLSG